VEVVLHTLAEVAVVLKQVLRVQVELVVVVTEAIILLLLQHRAQ
jgi:hypothetical protein